MLKNKKMTNLQNIKKEFPIFSNYPKLVYLDNAATTQKPKQVLDALNDFYTKSNANVHRGIHKLSELATEKYEEARKNVAEFISASPEEIIFTGGTTDGLNALANSLNRSQEIFGKHPSHANKNLQILSSDIEHHSNLLPWTRLANKSNIFFAGVDKNYQIDLNELEEIKRKHRIDIVAITMMSNVTGTITPIEKIRELFPDSILIVDAAQAIAHMPIDVKKLGVDFLAFSGHKIYGPTGIGVLFGKHELLEKLEPLKVGGGMISEVYKDKSVWADVPEKHEAGTPPIAQAIGLSEALHFMKKADFKNIQKHEDELRAYAVKAFNQIPEIELYHPDLSTQAGAVISFNIKRIHGHDTAQVLADQDIAVRAGHHCAQIFHREVLEVAGSVRASLAIYNKPADIDKLIKGIKMLYISSIIRTNIRYKY